MTRLRIKREVRVRYGPAVRLALISLVLCGLLFPLLVTGFAQALFPNQANGNLLQVNGRTIGSSLIAQEFHSPIFFHPRNASLSASGVDPDITVQDAASQIPRISSATGLSTATLSQIVSQNTEGQVWIFGTPYVNVLRLNIALIQTNNPSYSSYARS